MSEAKPQPPRKPFGVEKKPFVPHPHLSSSPLRDNEALAALRDSLKDAPWPPESERPY